MVRSAGRVLLIEDDELQRFTTCALLEDRGYTVRAAASLAEARQALDEPDFDLVLLDLHLGDGVGTALVPAVRRRQPRACIALLCGSPEEVVGRARVDLVVGKGSETGRLLDQLGELITHRAALAG